MINIRNVKQFCNEDTTKIENYELAIADKTQTWECHHRGEILPCGNFSRDDLKKFCLYWNRPAEELIFLTKAEHRRLHKKGNKNCLGKKYSDEHKKKISNSLKGKNTWMKGKKLSGETKRKISLSMIGKNTWMKGKKHSDETRRKMSEARKMYWEKQRQLKTNPTVGTQL